MNSDQFTEARPWLVHGVVKGTSRLAKDETFAGWVESETTSLAALRRRSKRTSTRASLTESTIGVLNRYADECEEKADQAVSALQVLLSEVLCLSIPPDSRCWAECKTRLCFLYWYGQAEDWLKFHLNSLFCLSTGQELPPAPDLCEWGPVHMPGIFLSGCGYRALRRVRMMNLDTKVASLLLAKKGMPAMQNWKIQKSLQKHRVALTAKAPRTVRELEDIVAQVERTVDEVFGPRRCHDVNFRIPSCSGHLSSSRLELGAFGELVGHIPKVLADLGSYRALGVGALFPDGEEALNGLDVGWNLDVLPGDVYDWDGAANELRRVLDPLLPYTLEEASEIAQGLVDHVWSDPVVERGPHRCRAVAIPEPLKVRVVTGGPEHAYYLASYVQKLVHSELRKHRTFQLIGRPLERGDLEFVCRGMRPDWVLVSGDYQAATDGLEPVLSVACATRISRNLDLGWRATDLFRSTLVDHLLSYEPTPWDGESERDWHRQTMGQLMGSPTSFPILCLVNAAVTRHALEQARGEVLSLEDCNMLINGDDILFPSPRSGVSLWEQETARCGLVKSVGKNYVSAEFCTINSDLWIVRGEVDWFGLPYWVPDHCPSVNLGLLLGRNVKKGCGLSALAPSETFRFQDISQMAWDLIRGHDEVTSERLMTRFISSWSDTLKAVPPGVSWFVPKALGGLGLPWTRPGLPDLSKQQYKLATYMASGCSVEEHVRRKALLQEKLGTLSLWEKAAAILRKGMRATGLGSLSFGDQPDDPTSDWLGVISSMLFLNGESPEEVVTDRAKALWSNWFKLWRKGTAHSMESLTWETINSIHGKEVKISLPSPPSSWGIKVDVLSQRNLIWL
jgi:hypothetical protein